MSNANSQSIAPRQLPVTRSQLTAGPVSAAALGEARRMAAEAAVLIAEGPLRRAIADNTSWTRSSDAELEMLRRLQDVDVELLRRRTLLHSRRVELERTTPWAPNVSPAERRAG